jgi:hypothetical protein
MSDPAVPAPPPAGRLSAVERGARGRRIAERAPRGWSCDQRLRPAADDMARADAGRFQFGCTPLICLDRPRNGFPNISTPKGLVERCGSGRRPARGSPTAARRPPRAVSIWLHPSDLPRSAEKWISEYFHTERTCRAMRLGAPPRAGKPDGGAPARFQFACNPLICRDRPRNGFPNISTPKGFLGRGAGAGSDVGRTGASGGEGARG